MGFRRKKDEPAEPSQASPSSLDPAALAQTLWEQGNRGFPAEMDGCSVVLPWPVFAGSAMKTLQSRVEEARSGGYSVGVLEMAESLFDIGIQVIGANMRARGASFDEFSAVFVFVFNAYFESLQRAAEGIAKGGPAGAAETIRLDPPPEWATGELGRDIQEGMGPLLAFLNSGGKSAQA